MKTISALFITALALTLSARAADPTVKLTDVHMCCDSCVKGAQKAIATVDGVTAVISKDDETVTLTAADNTTLQKAADALVAAGFYGKSSDENIKINATTGAKGQQLQTMNVNEVHLCCGKCVSAVNTALGTVTGVTTNTATKGAKTFAVAGDFNDKEVFNALQKAGLTGKEQ